MQQVSERAPYLMIAGIKAPFLAICLLHVPVPLLQRKTLDSGATGPLTHLQQDAWVM